MSVPLSRLVRLKGTPKAFLSRLPRSPRSKRPAFAKLNKGLVSAGLATLILLWPTYASAQSLKLQKGALLEERVAPKQIQVTVGKSKILDSKEAIKRVSITEPKVADVVAVSVHQIIINGKRIGATSLVVWNEDGSHTVFGIWVTPDAELVRRRLDELIPRHRVEVDVDRDKLVLSGEVGDLQTMEQILTVVRPHTKEIINLMKVKSPQQVQLQVRIALVSRPALREAGISLTGARQTEDVASFGSPGSNVSSYTPGATTGILPPGPIAAPAAPAFSLIVQLADTALRKQASVAGFLSILESQGFARTLAEPTLVSLSGQTASFLSGGEFPVPIVSDNDVDVTFKEFGVRLKFTPTVLGDETIWLKVAPEVSEVSFDLGTTAGLLTVPGLTSQRAETTIQLKDGQTFIIAGLLKDKTESQIQKIPLLGDIPILGALFRQVRHSRSETELLIAVTPRLVKPLGPEEVIPMPGDEADYDPNDFELFLLGKLTHTELGEKTPEAKAIRQYKTSQTGPGGYLGYIR